MVRATSTVAETRKSPSTGLQTSTPRWAWNQSARRVSVRTRVPSSADATTEAGLKMVQPSNPGMNAAGSDPVGRADSAAGDRVAVVAGTDDPGTVMALADATGLELDSVGAVGASTGGHEATRTARRAAGTRLAAGWLTPLTADEPLAVLLDHLHVLVDVSGLGELPGHLAERRIDHRVSRRDVLGLEDLLHEVPGGRRIDGDPDLALHVDGRIRRGRADRGHRHVLEVDLHGVEELIGVDPHARELAHVA